MIKQILFTVALLAPGVAYAANPSAPFSVQVVDPPNEIACDIGPPYTGQIPVGAQAQGFTHCAVNLDFTQFTNANQIIDCLGANPPLLYINTGDPNQTACDSAHISIVSDGGSNSLKLLFSAADANAGKRQNQPQSVHTGPANSPYSGFTLPVAFYIEGVWRVNSANPGCSIGCFIWAPFNYQGGYGDGGPFFEVDLDETYGNPQASDGTAWGERAPDSFAGVTPKVPGPPNITAYGTYGTRFTANGVDSVAACSYFSAGIVNGSQSGPYNCDGPKYPGDATAAGVWTSRTASYLILGPAQSTQTHGFTLSGDEIAWVKRYTIWECPGWRDDNSNISQSPNQCNNGANGTAP